VLWWFLLPRCPRDTCVLITKNTPGHPVSEILKQAEEGSGLERQPLAKNPSVLRRLVGRTPKRGFKRIHHYVGDYDKVLTIPLLPFYHRECEYAIPVARTVKALKAMWDIVEEGDISPSLPVEVRFVARDEILLSPCYSGAVNYIGVSTLVNSTEVFERFEPLMKTLGGRPHWGKCYTITRDEVANIMYPSTYGAFLRRAERIGPGRRLR
jgi:hypothetical protein